MMLHICDSFDTNVLSALEQANDLQARNVASSRHTSLHFQRMLLNTNGLYSGLENVGCYAPKSVTYLLSLS